MEQTRIERENETKKQKERKQPQGLKSINQAFGQGRQTKKMNIIHKQNENGEEEPKKEKKQTNKQNEEDGSERKESYPTRIPVLK